MMYIVHSTSPHYYKLTSKGERHEDGSSDERQQLAYTDKLVDCSIQASKQAYLLSPPLLALVYTFILIALHSDVQYSAAYRHATCTDVVSVAKVLSPPTLRHYSRRILILSFV